MDYLEVTHYYRPNVEDFCVGFEFEVKNINGGWSPVILDPDTPVSAFADKEYWIDKNGDEHTRYSIGDSLRVKLLNHDDLVDLGWKDMSPMAMSCYEKGEFQLYLHDWYEKGFLFIQIFNVLSNIVYEGKIKNKIELKKIMKQLEIE